MAENSKIEWTDHTWSPWEGCQKAGPGCDHCYAEGMNRWLRKGVNWGPGAPRREYSDEHWAKPLRWNAAAAKAGTRPKVFPSVCDPFDNAVDPAWRAKFFALIASTPNLTWLLLTKRIGNVAGMIEAPGMQKCGLPENVWLGATIVNQEEADRDIPKLLATPARVRFLSMEPLLGLVDLRLVAVPADQDQLRRSWDVEGYKFNALQLHDDDRFHQPPSKLDWVIVGGESGPGARPMHPDWARSLRDQCAAAGVAFLLKQWGEFIPENQQDRSTEFPTIVADGAHGCPKHGWPDTKVHCWSDGSQSYQCGKKAAGRLLDGVTHDGFPE